MIAIDFRQGDSYSLYSCASASAILEMPELIKRRLINENLLSSGSRNAPFTYTTVRATMRDEAGAYKETLLPSAKNLDYT